MAKMQRQILKCLDLTEGKIKSVEYFMFTVGTDCVRIIS